MPETLNFGLANGLQVVDTATTGYAQRKLIKLMEDNMIAYDNTVRNANGKLLQIIYGDSGADTTKQYEYSIRMLDLNNEELRNKYQFTSQELKNYSGFSEKDNDHMMLRDNLREYVQRAKNSYISSTIAFMVPVNINRIIDTIMSDSSYNKSKEELAPTYIIDKLDEILDNKYTTILCMSEKERNNTSSFKYRDGLLHKTTFKTALHDALSPKRVIIEKKINKVQFDKIIDDIVHNFNKNLIEAGEMAGIVAAQSTGEQLTQFQLNAFHHAGIAKIGGTQGVPRMQELLSVSKKPKTPQMIIYLNIQHWEIFVRI